MRKDLSDGCLALAALDGSRELVLMAFQAMIENTKDMVFLKDRELTYVAASRPFVRMCGKNSAAEILGRTDLDIFEDRSLAQRYQEDDIRLMEGGTNLLDYMEPLQDVDGRARYGLTSKYVILDSDGTACGILGVTKDVTKDYVVRQHYQQELKYLFELPSDAYASVFIDIDTWRIVGQRRQVVDGDTMQEAHTVESLLKASRASIVDKDCPAAEFYRDFSPEYLLGIYDSGKSNLSFDYKRFMVGGEAHWVRNDVHFLVDMENGHKCIMLSAKCIDSEKEAEQNLVLSAQLDKMTMLLNRETTMKRIRKILLAEPDSRHALFMLDVDNFKQVNDTMGHQAGDDFLVALAWQLRGCFRDDDVIGRLGGDEFFVLMKSVPDTEIAEIKAQSVLDAVSRVTQGYPGLPLSVSIGISVYPADGTTIKELYARADKALYKAKSQGKNQFELAGQDGG